ncbi:polyprotein [Rhynchospora pubera]|uniref:Polyprotein n=1 Tax=Rhynchospora pubera TaxID=906938 RepID=A0AAV8GJ36_9POAL|nr:polyprotein [Rhynchospora pubera]
MATKQSTDEKIRILREEVQKELVGRLEDNREALSSILHQQSLQLEAKIDYKQDSMEKRLDELTNQMQKLTEVLSGLEKGKVVQTNTGGTSMNRDAAGTSVNRIAGIQPVVPDPPQNTSEPIIAVGRVVSPQNTPHHAYTSVGTASIPPPPTPVIGLTNLNPHSEAYYPDNHATNSNFYTQIPNHNQIPEPPFYFHDQSRVYHPTYNPMSSPYTTYPNHQYYPQLQTHPPNQPQVNLQNNPFRNFNAHNQRPNPFQTTTLPAPRLEFPTFNGNNPRGWLYKCEKFFQMAQIPERLKLEVATMHMQGKAETWVQGVVRDGMFWEEFAQEVIDRFEPKTTMGLVGEFNKLKQLTDVESYRCRFEELRLLMLKENHTYDEQYFMTSYLSGLKEELRLKVLGTRPRNLKEVYESSIYQEMLVELKRKQKMRPHTQHNSAKVIQASKNYIPKVVPSGVKTAKEEKECYKCHGPWFPGHKCNLKAVNTIIVDSNDENAWPESFVEENEIEMENPSHVLLPAPENQCDNEEVRISLHAMGENRNLDLIRLRGEVKGIPITALVDSGSTHTFVDPKVIEEAGFQVTKINPMIITVANGEKMQCDTKCEGFTWCMQGNEFDFDVRVMEIGAYDMLLGGDWIRKMGPILLDVKSLTLAMIKEGTKIELKGIQNMGELQLIDGAELGEEFKDGAVCMLTQLYPIRTSETEILMPKPLQNLLTHYSDIFQEPKTLPPKRTHDHIIPLKKGTEPMNLRPYRYSKEQKEEIEKIIDEMLAASIINPSSSPFASPALLVKKKDSSWRLCIDYRKLNSFTIKNKYPIPVVDELLEELKGAEIFSKIDLRAGYHQIRVKEEDIHKTAFRVHHGHFEFKVMPFGLTNAPASFQNLMNDVFKKELRKCVLVFFDDILVYSKSMADHLIHLENVFMKLREHQLFAKMSKCSFGKKEVEYLGHIISKDGVATDASKVEVMLNWPEPKTIRELRGFLGLTGYYRRFIKNYGVISKSLTDLLKKNSFGWNEQAQEAFGKLKRAMSSAPVLALPDFTQPFYIETDACDVGVGAVLSQGGRPIAYLSKSFGPKNRGKSTYEKELLAVLMAIDKWRHYLQGKQFIIKTDHQSLKHLLEQKLTHQLQHKALTKFIGLDYIIEFKKGKANVVADALSRRSPTHNQDTSNFSNHLNTLHTSFIQPLWEREVKRSYANDELATKLLQELEEGDAGNEDWKLENGVIKRKGRLYVGSDAAMKEKIMKEFHASSIGGHSGMQATYQRIKRAFYWSGMKREICSFVRECDICQRNKNEHVPYPGLLQPLPIPEKVWDCITMDFIEGLPISEGKNVIFVVVDRLTKYAHFMALSHPYSAQGVAKIFMENICKLHGVPSSIVSDRDPVFTSQFWKGIFKQLGTTLHYSTAYHPQTDGQSERVNQYLETYLRCMVNTHPKKWNQWLALAEYWYNTSYHTSLKCTPFEALYGYAPPHMELGNSPVTSIEPIDDYLKERCAMLHKLKAQLTEAQARTKYFADKHRTERELEVGDFAYLKLQPYRQTSLAVRKCLKLSSRYYGPFLVVERIGKAAYRLQLPPDSQVHPVFHISQLKKCIGKNSASPTLPIVGPEGSFKVEPVEVVDRKIVNRNGTPVAQILVRWSNLPDDSATWEDYLFIKRKFPEFVATIAP